MEIICSILYITCTTTCLKYNRTVTPQIKSPTSYRMEVTDPED